MLWYEAAFLYWCSFQFFSILPCLFHQRLVVPAETCTVIVSRAPMESLVLRTQVEIIGVPDCTNIAAHCGATLAIARSANTATLLNPATPAIAPQRPCCAATPAMRRNVFQHLILGKPHFRVPATQSVAAQQAILRDVRNHLILLYTLEKMLRRIAGLHRNMERCGATLTVARSVNTANSATSAIAPQYPCCAATPRCAAISVQSGALLPSLFKSIDPAISNCTN